VALQPLFVDSQYELRSGWKFAAYSTLLVVLFVATGTALGMMVAWLAPSWFELRQDDIRLLGLNAVALLFPSAGALIVMARYVDRVPISVFGVAVHDRWLQNFGVGLGVSGGMLGLTLAGSFIFGSVQMYWSASPGTLPGIGITLAVLAISAANEELVFRGYPLQILIKGIGPWGGMILISSIFGLLHARNEGATLLSVLNTILAGIFLSLAYLKTRSLWLPYGIHIGWNAGLALVLGFPVSGLQTPSLLETQVSGPPAILGGGYGPEDGVLGTVIFLAVAVTIRRMRAVKVSPQLRSTLAAHAGKVYVEGT
jgi:uncharacterized protein